MCVLNIGVAARVRQFAFKNSHFYPMPSTFKRVSSRILRNCCNGTFVILEMN
jgi:hypothetical protein